MQQRTCAVVQGSTRYTKIFATDLNLKIYGQGEFGLEKKV